LKSFLVRSVGLRFVIIIISQKARETKLDHFPVKIDLNFVGLLRDRIAFRSYFVVVAC